ncbi:MAG: alpha/beta hydrolase, partial [Dehalococcoidia bacterium]|nr:alpha/beta hydrolase [Dehalococcoidia bacterium]
ISGIGDVERSFRNAQTQYYWRKLLARLEESRRHRVSTGKIDHIKIGRVLYGDPDTITWAKKNQADHPEAPIEITTDSVEAIIQYKPESVVSRIAPRPIMWVHSKDDDLLPYEESRRMYVLASEPKKLVLLEGFGHYDLYEGAGLKATMDPTVAWFEEHL